MEEINSISDVLNKAFNKEPLKIVNKKIVNNYIVIDCRCSNGNKTIVYKKEQESLIDSGDIEVEISESKRSPFAIFKYIENDSFNLVVRLFSNHSDRKENKIYTNGLLVAPDGEVLSRIGKDKADWYIKKGLVDKISDSPVTLKLKFEPNGRGHKDDLFYLEEKEDICVVSGRTDNLTKHHIIPQCFRKFFPDHYKNHSYHDVLLLNREIHDDYEKKADILKKQLSEKYNIPMHRYVKKIESGKNGKNLKAMAISLLNDRKNNSNMPVETVLKYTNMIKKYLKKEEITDEDLTSILDKEISAGDKFIFGKAVVDSVESLQDFVVIWRKHFVENTNPKFLPKHWDVNRPIEVK